MRMLLKLSILSLTIGVSASVFAKDFCSQINGLYQGYYQDLGNLFPHGQFPLALTIQYQNGKLYGYSRQSHDALGANFGSRRFLLSATCKNSRISNVTFIPQIQHCGALESNTDLVKSNKTLKLYLHYQNAMIDTELVANLKSTPSPSPINQKLIHYAQNLQYQKLKTCH